MKTVYFVRHGESEANVLNLAGLDAALTPKGREQARRAGQTLKTHKPIDTIIASPITRAKHTAQLIAEELGHPVDNIEHDDRIREIGVGIYEGKELTPAVRQHIREHYVTTGNPIQVESAEEIEARSRAFLEDLHSRPEEVFLVVGHNFSGRWLRRVIGGHDHSVPVGRFENGEVTILLPEAEATDVKELVL